MKLARVCSHLDDQEVHEICQCDVCTVAALYGAWNVSCDQNWQEICNGSNQVFQESYFTYKNGTKFLTRKGEIPVA